MPKRKAAQGPQALQDNPHNAVITAPVRKVMHKRYTIPTGKPGQPTPSCRTFVMRELTSGDQREAAMWADAKRDATTADTPYANLMLERHEAMRLSFVRVDDRPVNVEGVPFVEFDTWTFRSLAFARMAFNAMNGAEDDEVEDFLEGAEILAGEPQIANAPAVASTGG